MNTEIQTFNFNSATLRTLTDENGDPWFVAKDVCNILGLNNVGQTLTRLDDDGELREWLSQHGWTYRHARTLWAASDRVKTGHLVMVESRAYGRHKDGSAFAFAPTAKITRKGLVLLHKRLGETRLNETLETTTH